MSEKSTLPKKYEIDFKRPSNNPHLHVDGIWGGPTISSKYLIMEFFTDVLKQTNTVTYEITAKGLVGNEINREPKSKTQTNGEWDKAIVDRVIQSSLVVDIETAEIIGNWILENVKNAKENVKKAKDDLKL